MTESVSKNKRKCYCSWTECEFFRSIIISNSDPTHPWTNDPIRIQFQETDPSKMTINKYAYYQSISRHLLDKVYMSVLPSSNFLYPRNFPISL